MASPTAARTAGLSAAAGVISFLAVLSVGMSAAPVDAQPEVGASGGASVAGDSVASRNTNGVVAIADATATATPIPATTLPSPTSTRSPGPTFTVRSANGPDGCSLAPGTEPRTLGALYWLAAPLALWWVRRRSP